MTRKSKFSASTSSIDALGVIEYPFLPMIGSFVNPMTIVLIPSSCIRYIGWNSSRSSNSSVAIMAAVFPFRSFGIAYNRLGLDWRYQDLAGIMAFWVTLAISGSQRCPGSLDQLILVPCHL